jgi:hypothetical protein
VCSDDRPARVRELSGRWIVDRAYGPERYVAGRQLLQFGSSGGFVADPDGPSGREGAITRGRYRVDDEVMVISSTNSTGCGAGSRATWRATIGSDDRLTMVYLGGDCPEGERGNVWVAHRLTRR